MLSHIQIINGRFFLVNLDPTIGSEQAKTRPVLVISNEDVNRILPIIDILPITSRKANRIIYPNEVLIPSNGANLPKESIVLCHQIRAIDKKRLISRVGVISDDILRDQIQNALRFQLDL